MAEETAKVGRPLKFKSAKELQTKIEEYFESCYEERWYQDGGEWKPVTDRNGKTMKDLIKPMTVSGLAVYLETSRNTLLEYEGKEEYVNTIKRAKDRIENFAEESLFTNKQTAGIIFNLVNNHKWVNKQEIDNNHNGDMNIVVNRRRMNSDERSEH